MMLAHVDELASLYDCAEGGLHDVFGASDKCYNRAVRGFAWIYVEKLHALNGLDFACNLVNGFHVAPLAKIGDALNNLLIVFHKCVKV